MGYSFVEVDYVLPSPTEDEINLGLKMDYFSRLLEMDLDKKFKISENELHNWIHHNYSSIFLTEQELTLTKFRKLQR
jgi:hypothetical protein